MNRQPRLADPHAEGRYLDEYETTAVVYRAYESDGGLLYVGYSASPDQRIEQHRNGSSGQLVRPCDVAVWTIAEFACRADAHAAEAEAIRTEHPQCNVLGVDHDRCSHPSFCRKCERWTEVPGPRRFIVCDDCYLAMGLQPRNRWPRAAKCGPVPHSEVH